MSPKAEALRARIAEAGEAGLSLSRMKSGNKAQEAELRETLAALAREGAIRGPFKSGASQLYFAAGAGPSVEKVADVVADIVRGAGIRLLSKKALEGKVKGLNKRFFADALKEAAARRAILEVACGPSKFYLHRDIAAERLDLQAEAGERELGFDDLAQVCRRLKAEQGGLPAVKISDVVKALGVAPAQAHALIAREAKAGRVSLYPSDSVNLPSEAREAALRLPGHAEPFVTLALRDER